MWDGEGLNLNGKNSPQCYVLFGCSTGEYITSETHLNTFEILDFILKIGQENPDAFHAGFAFGYDGNMIIGPTKDAHMELNSPPESGSILPKSMTTADVFLCALMTCFHSLPVVSRKHIRNISEEMYLLLCHLENSSDWMKIED
jgi:hypothetical protein